jgi:hypothetical protein
VSHSSVSGRIAGYQAAMRGIVEQLAAGGAAVGVKYHPRQAEPDYLQLTTIERTTLLPQGLPLEFLYIRRAPPVAGAGRPLRVIVGDISTTLLTARWLAPEARCISLARPLGLLDASIEQLFSRLGVHLPAALEQVW